MQELWCNEHYAWMLVPWVHYVPVDTDMEGLVDTVEWLRAHNDVAARIGANAQAFAKQHLSRDSLLTYHHTLLKSYAALYRPSDGPRGAQPRCPAADAVPPRGGVQGRSIQLCKRAPR